MACVVKESKLIKAILKNMDGPDFLAHIIDLKGYLCGMSTLLTF